MRPWPGAGQGGWRQEVVTIGLGAECRTPQHSVGAGTRELEGRAVEAEVLAGWPRGISFLPQLPMALGLCSEVSLPTSNPHPPEPQIVTLRRNRVFAGVIGKGAQDKIILDLGWVPNPVTGALTKRGNRQGRPCEDGGRDWIDVATSQGKPEASRGRRDKEGDSCSTTWRMACPGVGRASVYHRMTSSCLGRHPARSGFQGRGSFPVWEKLQ